MLFSATHVATITNFVISAHGGYIPDIAPIDDTTGMRIMFEVCGYELTEALNTIKEYGGVSTKTAYAALNAVRAYLNI